MSNKTLNGFLFLMAGCLLMTLQWGCSKTTTTPTPTASGVPFTTLFSSFDSTMQGYTGSANVSSAGSNGANSALNAAFAPVFASVGPYAAAGSGSWVIGLIMGIDQDVTGSSPVSSGYTWADVSVNNTAVTNAAVTLTPSGGTPIPLGYLASASYKGYNFSMYGAASAITYSPTTSYTLSATGIGDTATSTLTPPGGNAFSFSGPDVTDTITSLGLYDAAFVLGVQYTPPSSVAVTLSYYGVGTSSGWSDPFVYPAAAYSPLSSGATFISGFESINWTTTVSSATTIKGGLIGVDCGIAMSTK